MNIDDMQAGRGLDALVAIKWLGWKYRFTELDGIPHFSTDIAAAFQAVEKLNERGFTVVIVCKGKRFQCWGEKKMRTGTNLPDFHAEADTAALAICRAALKAVEGE